MIGLLQGDWLHGIRLEPCQDRGDLSQTCARASVSKGMDSGKLFTVPRGGTEFSSGLGWVAVSWELTIVYGRNIMINN